jgi:hypothetical protein
MRWSVANGDDVLYVGLRVQLPGALKLNPSKEEHMEQLLRYLRRLWSYQAETARAEATA